MNERRFNKLTKMWQKVYRTVEDDTEDTLDRRIGGFITGGKLRGDLITGAPGGGSGEHAANHYKDGSDPISLDLLATVENDTDLVLRPDGNGGVVWEAAPSGSNGQAEPISLSVDGTVVGSQSIINFMTSQNIDIFVEEDTANERINVKIIDRNEPTIILHGDATDSQTVELSWDYI